MWTGTPFQAPLAPGFPSIGEPSSLNTLRHGHPRRPARLRDALLTAAIPRPRPEQQKLIWWQVPSAWDCRDDDASGRGKFLIRVGGRAGIPVRIGLTWIEASLNKTNKPWHVPANRCRQCIPAGCREGVGYARPNRKGAGLDDALGVWSAVGVAVMAVMLVTAVVLALIVRTRSAAGRPGWTRRPATSGGANRSPRSPRRASWPPPDAWE